MGRPTQHIVISGSREWTDYSFILHRVQMLEHPARVRCGYDPINKTPRGADQLVVKACRSANIRCDCFPADWLHRGRVAGFERNEEMFADGKVDHFIAFWIGNSRGTRDAVRRAYQHDVPWIEIHRRPA